MAEKNKGLILASGQESFWPHVGPIVFLAGIFLINFVARIVLSPLLPAIERELEMSHTQAGLLFFLISGGYLVGLILSGFVAAGLTHKSTIVVSTAGTGAALLASASASHLPLLQLGLCALGFATGLYIPSAIATITAQIDPRHWGKAISVHELAPNLGFFTAPFFAELFLRRGSWRAALATLGAAAVAAAVLYARYGRGGEFAGISPRSSALRLLVGLRSFWIMLLLFAWGISSTIGVYAMLPLYLVSERQITPSWANALVAFSRSYGPVLGVFGGWVTDRLGVKRTLVVSLTFTGALSFLLGPASDRWLAVVVLLQPLLAVWFFPAGFAALARITPPQARNLAVSFAVPFGFLVGAGLIPTLIGRMGDAGSFALGFSITGALILSGAGLALLLQVPGERQAGELS
ncbi:MAG TPA: MFS transporter [candidate division Zixibacteria bacterium]|nr:MFS transporter [candidate division Zixibacteria bacterium]